MRRFLLHLSAGSCLFLVLFLIGFSQTAQPPAPNGNPLTGNRNAYNPYLGQAKSPKSPLNPYTGNQTEAYRNPFTGQMVYRQAQPNALTGGGGRPAAPPAHTQWPDKEFPITGDAGPGLQALDDAIRKIMDRHGVPGAALAVAKDGRLVYAKGFGWADLAAGLRVHPLTLFGIASLSKPITAMAILKLVQDGKLGLDDRVFDILKHIRPRRGSRVDPRIYKVTVRQCLNHSGGWDRQRSGDPITWSPTIARAFKSPLPITNEQFISFMMGMPLDFEPGTKAVYSNVGFMLLDAVVSKVSKIKYEAYVRRNVLIPMGVRHAVVTSPSRKYLNDEAKQYLAGNGVMLPPMRLPMAKGAAGWSSTVVDLVRFLSTLDGSAGKQFLNRNIYQQMVDPPPAPIRPRANGEYCGLGWPNVSFSKKGLTYSHTGKWYGMRSFMKRTEKGVNWALVFNVGMEPDNIDVNVVHSAVDEVRRSVDAISDYPDVDFFKKYR